MLIIGAKGFAKEVLEIYQEKNQLTHLAFYDDINDDAKNLLYNRFPILKNKDEVAEHFNKYGNSFTIGIGNPTLRERMYDKFTNLGGQFVSTISIHARISSFDTFIGDGCNILAGSVFSNSVVLGKGCMVYYNAIITHDCVIGNFVELSPGAKVLGDVVIGSYSQIGANSTILPKLKIGENVVVGAGAVVTKDLPDNCVAVGIPAKIIKQN